ncbi:hypothetical protein FA95DRAFT_808384 [Auriscalpium vulgare]|uniref:Uncharacterized protein n=1 Tax=Auriscalpium vulgare TaxID=40419 RepID=A0ACB8R9W7_9AGAM|nr:hypothetical protein FA95DRAFT_808384 [Auriscalpium vulgare]
MTYAGDKCTRWTHLCSGCARMSGTRQLAETVPLRAPTTPSLFLFQHVPRPSTSSALDEQMSPTPGRAAPPNQTHCLKCRHHFVWKYRVCYNFVKSLRPHHHHWTCPSILSHRPCDPQARACHAPGRKLRNLNLAQLQQLPYVCAAASKSPRSQARCGIKLCIFLAGRKSRRRPRLRGHFGHKGRRCLTLRMPVTRASVWNSKRPQIIALERAWCEAAEIQARRRAALALDYLALNNLQTR